VGAPGRVTVGAPECDDVAMFDVDAFVDRCKACLDETEPRRAIREELDRALDRSDEITDRLPPEEAGLDLLYRSADLTVLKVVWAPKMRLYPHDHRMWAAIGIYTGREDNEFFRRGQDGEGGLVESGGKRLGERDVVLLGDDVIHAVANPARTHTGAIHIYGGDFVAQARSQWVPPALREEPYDMALVHQEFDRAERAWRGTSTA
jgi:predicted metal-dependent enzyme (double-stranded beta helix superfamily)